MPTRRADADARTFFDQYERIKASYFRARNIIDPAKNVALIPCAEGTKLLGTCHNRLKYGGGWSFFRCPQCANRASVLYLVASAPRCVKCCRAMNIRHRSVYGFGRDARRRASDKHLDQLIAKVETSEPLRFKPAPSSWGGRAQIVYNSRSLATAKQRAMITLRLNQLASDYAKAANGHIRNPGHQPQAAKQIVDLTPIWRARSTETMQQALDKAQVLIIAALSSPDLQTRMNAAKLMLRTKQARERGW